MSNIYPIYTDRVRYKLTQNPTGQQIVEEPSGFRNDDNEFIRDKSFHGIFPQMTNNLTFYNQGGLYITAIYNDFGINADLILTKEERNPKTDIWELVYTGFLDFSTYSRKDEGVSIKFVSSGLLRVIKARESEKIELDRLDTLKGNEIPYLEPSQVALGGRNIQLNSLLETEKELAYTTTPISSSPGLRMLSMRFQTKSTRTATIGYPMTVTYVSDISVNQFVGGNLSQTTTPTEGRQQAMFYAVSEKDTTLQLKIKYNFNIFKGNTYLGGQSDIKDLSNASMHLRLTVYENGTDYDFKEVVIDNLTPNLISGSNFTTALQSGDFEYDLQLLKGESASLEFYARATRWGDFIGSIGLTYGNLRASFQNMTGSIEIIRDSQYEPSLSKIHFPFNVANRFLKLFTEQDDLLVSNVLGKIEDGYEEDGEASLIAMAHGDYEEAIGLDEYNTRTTLTTIIDKVKSSFKAVSGYRADSYGAEFARRKPYVTFPTEDTKYDNSIWIFDLIRNVNSAVFNQRLWQDDFSEEPTGVFSPATAQNLRLSPFNILRVL